MGDFVRAWVKDPDGNVLAIGGTKLRRRVRRKPGGNQSRRKMKR